MHCSTILRDPGLLSTGSRQTLPHFLPSRHIQSPDTPARSLFGSPKQLNTQNQMLSAMPQSGKDESQRKCPACPPPVTPAVGTILAGTGPLSYGATENLRLS